MYVFTAPLSSSSYISLVEEYFVFSLVQHLGCFRAVILNPAAVSPFVGLVWTRENTAITVGYKPNQLDRAFVDKEVFWYVSKPSQELCLD